MRRKLSLGKRHCSDCILNYGRGSLGYRAGLTLKDTADCTGCSSRAGDWHVNT